MVSLLRQRSNLPHVLIRVAGPGLRRATAGMGVREVAEVGEQWQYERATPSPRSRVGLALLLVLRGKVP
jgi:hypothetical protein